ncbi:MAG TPA: hypothetical protein VHE36_00840 [Sphingomicrobium sp.]|nr:hypothetical protein [Sphingomicrobium sp.]
MHNRVKVPPTSFHLKEGTLIERLPQCTLLFSEQDQQIHELNETSAVIAARLVEGATRKELLRALESEGVEPETAGRWIEAFLEETSRSGLLEAQLAQPAGPAAVRHIRLNGRCFSLRYGSPALENLVSPAFAHLEKGDGEAGEEFTLTCEGDLVFIATGNGLASVFPLASAAVRMKGLILERILAGSGHLAALHSACLVRDETAVLLLGSPGAGKTTLSIALMGEGFGYGSDDVTLVMADGTVEGVPLAPGLKEGAWELAMGDRPDLSAVAVHVRPDGEKVRYLPLENQELAGPSRVGAVIRLRRSGKHSPALEPVSVREGLAELFRESRSADGKCSTATMQALARLVRGARFLELRYSDSAEAALFLSERIAP